MSLESLEIADFKLFTGKHGIRSFKTFSAIIRPNDSGKSNFMDTISLVLGERDTNLRVRKLEDLIHGFPLENRREALENLKHVYPDNVYGRLVDFLIVEFLATMLADDMKLLLSILEHNDRGFIADYNDSNHALFNADGINKPIATYDKDGSAATVLLLDLTDNNQLAMVKFKLFRQKEPPVIIETQHRRMTNRRMWCHRWPPMHRTWGFKREPQPVRLKVSYAERIPWEMWPWDSHAKTVEQPVEQPIEVVDQPTISRITSVAQSQSTSTTVKQEPTEWSHSQPSMAIIQQVIAAAKRNRIKRPVVPRVPIVLSKRYPRKFVEFFPMRSPNDEYINVEGGSINDLYKYAIAMTKEVLHNMTDLPNVKLIYDVVQCTILEMPKAVQFACGNVLVTDDVKQARQLAYGADGHRAVALDGTLFQSSGLISGGGSDFKACAKRWDEQLIQKLEEEQHVLTEQLTTLKANSKRELDMEMKRRQIQSLESRIPYITIEINKRTQQLQ